jgi:DNA invertase Pin-like site-specific DNA recombinase
MLDNPKRAALYARVSTTDQNAESQLLELRKYAADRGWTIYETYVDNGVSGTKESRPALNKLMADMRKRKFDLVVVWRFDRFARSARHLVTALEEMTNAGVGFVSFQEGIDTNSPLGKAILTIVGAMGELERNIIVERVRMGLRRAVAEGKRLGRPKSNADSIAVRELRAQGKSLREIAKQVGASKSTVSRLLA